jgi:hypothetical protein
MLYVVSVIYGKIWGFHGGEYEEYPLPGYKNPVHTSQETHYFSATKTSRLMHRNFWGFHGGDSAEHRLLGCKNPFRTSQKTHYVSTREPSRLSFEVFTAVTMKNYVFLMLRRVALWEPHRVISEQTEFFMIYRCVTTVYK